MAIADIGLQIRDSNVPQLLLEFSAGIDTTFEVDSGGDLNVAPTTGVMRLVSPGTSRLHLSGTNAEIDSAAGDLVLQRVAVEKVRIGSTSIRVIDGIFVGSGGTGKLVAGATSDRIQVLGATDSPGFEVVPSAEGGNPSIRIHNADPGISNEFTLQVAGISAQFRVLAGTPAVPITQFQFSDVPVVFDLDITIGGQLLINDGSAAVPSLAFTFDIDTGIFRGGPDVLGFATGGGPRLFINSSNQVLHGDGAEALPAVSFINDPSTGLYRFGASSVAISGGASVRMRWDLTETVSNAQIRPWFDNTYGLGTATERWSIFYAVRSLLAGGDAASPAYSFASLPDSGLFASGADVVMSMAGANQCFFTPSQIATVVNLNPLNDNAFSLGTSSQRWSDLFSVNVTVYNVLRVARPEGGFMILQDTGAISPTDALGFISIRDNLDAEIGWMGFGSSTNANLTINNNVGNTVLNSGAGAEVQFQVANATLFRINPTAFYPNSTGAIDLGSTGNRFRSGYVNKMHTFSGTVALEMRSNASGILATVWSEYYDLDGVGMGYVGFASSASNNMYMYNRLADGDIWLGPRNGGVGGAVVPIQNNASNLGSSAQRWGTIYADNLNITNPAPVGYPLLAPSGSAAVPSYSFSASPGTGMWHNGSELEFSILGTVALQLADTSLYPGQGDVRDLGIAATNRWRNLYAVSAVLDNLTVVNAPWTTVIASGIFSSNVSISANTSGPTTFISAPGTILSDQILLSSPNVATLLPVTSFFGSAGTGNFQIVFVNGGTNAINGTPTVYWMVVR